MKYGSDGLLHFMQNFKDLHAGSESRMYIDFKHKANEQRKPTITSESYHYMKKKIDGQGDQINIHFHLHLQDATLSKITSG